MYSSPQDRASHACSPQLVAQGSRPRQRLCWGWSPLRRVSGGQQPQALEALVSLAHACSLVPALQRPVTSKAVRAPLARPGFSLLQPLFVSEAESLLGSRVCLLLSPLPALAQPRRCREPAMLQAIEREHLLFVFNLSLARRDSRLLLSYIASLLERSHFKGHRQALLGYSKALASSFSELGPRLGILGFRLKIRGKIGVGGNAKRRAYAIDLGGHSLSKKSNRVSFFFCRARTLTGILGLSLTLCF